MEKFEVTIIGAGVIGLAVACEIAAVKKNVCVLEKNNSFGQEASSRNSEVIHAGIYYPKGSLKTKLCIEGNALLYETCLKNKIPFKKLGKLIVAVSVSEICELEELFKNAKNNGVKEIEIITEQNIKKIEPNIEAKAAIYSKSTGIIDSHSLMKHLVLQAENKGAVITYNTEVAGIEKLQSGYKISIIDANKEKFVFMSEIVINCAGLQSDRIANLVGIDIDKENYNLYYCKGQYFRLSTAKSKYIARLIYPLPQAKLVGLGVHATPNMEGIVRLGPDEEYIEKNKLSYEVNDQKKTYFYNSVNKFLPFLKENDLSADTAGVRSKLQGPSQNFRDFIIREEKDLGFSGFVNTIGIESPGLTASLSIAKYIKSILK